MANAPGNIFFPTGSMLIKAYFCFNITPSYIINNVMITTSAHAIPSYIYTGIKGILSSGITVCSRNLAWSVTTTVRHTLGALKVISVA